MKNATIKALTLLLALALLLASLPAAIAEGATAIEDTLVVGINAEPTHLAGILQGRDVVTAGRMGAICGALATQTPGDVEGYPDAAQMEAALTGAAITYR